LWGKPSQIIKGNVTVQPV